MLTGSPHPDSRWMIDVRCGIIDIIKLIIKPPKFDVAPSRRKRTLNIPFIIDHDPVKHTMSRGEQLSTLQNHLDNMLVAVILRSSLRVMVKIKDIHYSPN